MGVDVRILFVRPPRYSWPFNSESSSYWQPLGLCCIAAYVREHIPQLKDSVEILDCLPLEMGWTKLKEYLKQEKFDIIGLGDETASANEAIKVAEFVKEHHPETIVVGGGYYFSAVVEQPLLKDYFDYIVIGEGEITFKELVEELMKAKKDFSHIKGLAYKENGKVRINESRPLIEDLDILPFPAYDLLPMHLYGRDSKNHPHFVAIEHGRGCTATCTFCSIYALHEKKENGVCVSSYRTKSAKKCLEEVDILVRRFGRQTLNWGDGTFNVDSKWNKEFAEGLLERDYEVKMTAWARSDYIVRDEKMGIFQNMVDAGLCQLVIGVERFDDQDLREIRKGSTVQVQKIAFDILKKYPSVYSIATVIYGMPNDSWKSLKRVSKIVHSDYADMIFILPYTPFPGTPLYKEIMNDNNFSDIETDLRNYNLQLPVMNTKHMSRKQLAFWFKWVLFWYIFRPGTLFRRIIFEKDARKRKLHKSIAKKISLTALSKAVNMVRLQKKVITDDFGVKPGWYD